MKLAITGSRSITSKDWINYHIDKYLEPVVAMGLPITIISGGARGVDSVAHEYADNAKYDFALYKPYHLVDNKEPFRARFFFARNKQIVDNADEVLVLWDGTSSGSKSVIEYATKMGKTLKVVLYDEREAKAIEDLNEGDDVR